LPGLGGLIGVIVPDANDLFVEQQQIGARDSGYFVWLMAAVSQALHDCRKGAYWCWLVYLFDKHLKNSHNDRVMEIVTTSHEFLKAMRAAMPRNWRNATPHSWTRLPEIF
jgi:hypothetical protein